MMQTLMTDKGQLAFSTNLPRSWNKKLVPGAQPHWYMGDQGSILLQQMQTENFSVRCFNFYLVEPLSVFCQPDRDLQSLLLLKGSLKHKLSEQSSFDVQAGEYLLWKGSRMQTVTELPAEQECILWSTSYSYKFLKQWEKLFPFLQKLKRKSNQPFLVFPNPLPVRTSVFDAIRAQFYDVYQPHLQKVFDEMKVQETLFNLLAPADNNATVAPLTEREKEIADKVHDIIKADITKHYSNTELARLVKYNEAGLKRIFKQRHGVGMFHFLQRLRFEKAKELLTLGELNIKHIASLTGYAHTTTFITEFRKYFGYTPLDCQKRSLRK